MEKDYLVSVIIPVCNVKPYLAEAMESVLSQTYRNLEIIVVDDGSVDGSGKICDAFARKDGRVQVIHQENRGLSGARNAGLDQVHGELLAFLDPDDAYRPDYIRTMADVMIREKPDLVMCRYTVHQTNGKMHLNGRRKPKPALPGGRYDRVEALRALVSTSFNYSVWNKLYKAELWKTIRFPDGHNYEDIDTMYRVLDLCRTIYVLEQPLYLNRRRAGGITNTLTQKNIRDWLLACEHLNLFVAENTPGIFVQENLDKIYRRQLNRMMHFYLRFSSRAAQGKKGVEEELRERIVEKGKDPRLRTCGIRTRTACRMITCCPGLIKEIYPLYRFFRVLFQTFRGQ